MSDDKVMIEALNRLLVDLPDLCVPPDGLFYAGDRIGIAAFEHARGRIKTRIEQWIEVLDDV